MLELECSLKPPLARIDRARVVKVRGDDYPVVPRIGNRGNEQTGRRWSGIVMVWSNVP